MKINHFLYCDVVLHMVKIGRIFCKNTFGINWLIAFFLFVAAAFALTRAAFASDNQDVNLVKPTCPSQNFPEFFFVYANSETIQRTFLRIPLKVQWLDLDVEPEPKPVVKKLKYAQIRFPLLPLRAEREEKSLSLRIDKWSENKAEATLFKQDTGYQVTYFFVKNECWVLTAIEDWSM
ncbi:hypothetical protein [Tepidiphilus margaritifer]|uniref:hypothetical protein n=1 Tax=Tepidiphilus margaritifer TaxID=203471 RepID=UPI0012FAD60B|nr:hypothetical protein [Tepidiphilus margaritifer]